MLTNQVLSIYKNSVEKSENSFNIFKILQIESDEVRLHSRILKSLIELNTYGFISSIPTNYWNKTSKPTDGFLRVRLEVPCSSLIEGTNDGRIDIIVEFENLLIIIENKIYASDQNQQLVKYHEYGKRSGKDFLLLYLTPTGKEPTNASISQANSNEGLQPGEYQLISYKKEILHWLEIFSKELESKNEFRGIHEIIRQYIQTLKNICLIMTEEQKERLQQLLENHEILNHAHQLKYDIETIENKIHDFWRRVSENISIEFEAGKQTKIDFREGSIMIDLFNQERGKFNCYLEYQANFNEIPFLSIWLNKSYSEKFKELSSDNEGYITKKPLSHFLSKDVFSEYVLKGNDSKSQSIYTDLNAEIAVFINDAQNSIQKLKTTSTDLIL
jgi:hypothetical protein